MAEHHDDDHDDFGGLQRDLLATGATMDRRRVLQLAAQFGEGWDFCNCLAAAIPPVRPVSTPAPA